MQLSKAHEVRGAVVSIMFSWFTAELERFDMTEGEIQWNRKDVFRGAENEYTAMKNINSKDLCRCCNGK